MRCQDKEREERRRKDRAERCQVASVSSVNLHSKVSAARENEETKEEEKKKTRCQMTRSQGLWEDIKQNACVLKTTRQSWPEQLRSNAKSVTYKHDPYLDLGAWFFFSRKWLIMDSLHQGNVYVCFESVGIHSSLSLSVCVNAADHNGSVIIIIINQGEMYR